MTASSAYQGKSGVELLHAPSLNKDTAFTAAERSALGLRGLLPPSVCDIDRQVERVMEQFALKPNDLEKYIFLSALQDRNETLFYRTVLEHIDVMVPIIYTPTVGQACQQFGHIFRRPRGLYICPDDREHIDEILDNWPHRDVRVIVVTDGQRILGLGDLGANGMGIPIGKLSLYTACAGIAPTQALPITLDVGTDNDELLNDPLYIGLRQRRLRGETYSQLLEAFMRSVARKFPQALIQFEDFGTQNAFQLLASYRDRYCCFNDDIQGTAAVVLASLRGALRITGQALCEQRILFLGAGEAATGIGQLIATAMSQEGLSPQQARARCWFFDSQGLLVSSRAQLAAHKAPFAQDAPAQSDLLAAIAAIKPTAIMGASGQAGAFSAEVIAAMAALNQRPIIFALSNPTSKAECTAEQAYRGSDGRAVFASGSPFAPVNIGQQRLVPGQGNNAYIFPGVGLGIVASAASRVTDEMFLSAAQTLAAMVSDEDLQSGCVLPSLKQIREVSRRIAIAVAELAHQQGLARRGRSDNIAQEVDNCIYLPDYPSYL